VRIIHRCVLYPRLYGSPYIARNWVSGLNFCVFQSAWQSGIVPDEWHRGIILLSYKGKGSKHDCRNYRRITLLSVPGKAFAHILLTRVKDVLVQSRRIQQSGFTRGRSTIDRIATLNMLHQTRREFSQPHWVAYVDLKAAFDSIDHSALWQLLTSRGLPPKVISLFQALYTGTTSCVSNQSGFQSRVG